MGMTKGLKRLIKLAEHLETGKLGHKRFDFNVYNNVSEPRCGTAGCAIGECPILFPSYWKWDYSGDPALRRGDSKAYSAFFEITQEEYKLLFIPSEEPFGLPPTATRKQVAKNIRDFVAAKLAKLNRWSDYV